MFDAILDSSARWCLAHGPALAWKSAALLAAAAAVALALRRGSAAARHLVWTLALAGLLALPALSLGIPGWAWPVLPAGEASLRAAIDSPTSTTSRPPADLSPIDPPGAWGRPASEPEASATMARAGAGTHVAPAPAPPISARAQDLSRGWPVALWMAGALAVVLPVLIGLAMRGRLGRSARPIEGGEWAELAAELAGRLGVARRVRLLQSDRSSMPMTWGWLRPVVLLPADAEGWSSERRRDVLLHELAHVRRLDCATQLLAQVACAVYWFNPLAWLAARQMRVERERACDDLVLRAGVRASDYAGHLLAMARDLRAGRAAALAAVAMARPSQLEGRLLAILDPVRRRGGVRRATAVLGLVGLLVALVPLAAVRLQARAAAIGPELAGRGAQAGDPAERMIVTGRVLDPDGKPVAGAPVDILGRPRSPWVGRDLDADGYVALGGGVTDDDGRFRVDAARTSENRFFEVYALASATGSGLGWSKLNPSAEQPAADVRLGREQPIVGKLLDVNGRPAAGVALRVGSVGRPTDLGLFDGVSMHGSQPAGVRNWPAPVETDDAGRFRLGGIGRDQVVRLAVEDPRFARQWIDVAAKGDVKPTEVTQALQPATIVEGRVLAGDTGEPIPGAVVAVASGQDQFIGGPGDKFVADAEGRYRANVRPGKYYSVTGYAPLGRPYLIFRQEFEWTKGEARKEFDVRLPRGTLLRGKVTEEGSGRPLAGASIQFFRSSGVEGVVGDWQAIEASAADGTYQIAVPSEKGHLLVFGPTSDFVLEEVGYGKLAGTGEGGQRYYAHDILPYDAKAADGALEINSALRPGKTVRGRLVGPGGETVEEAQIITTLHIEPFNPSWRGDFQLEARDGRFELHGLPAGKAERVYFLDADHRWGAAVELSGDQAGEDLTIRLRPCGQARARLVGPDGKPVANVFPHFEILGKPGSHQFARGDEARRALVADAAYMPNVDRKHYWNGPMTDAEGRITLPDLIPGALYRISDFSTVNDDKGVQVRKDFTVEPGGTSELGDILIEKPQS